MAAVIVVFVIWFAALGAVGMLAVTRAPDLRAPSGVRRVHTRLAAGVDAALPQLGRATIATTVLLAGWSAVIIIGWVLGLGAHRLEPIIDKPAFRWWQDHHLGGTWSSVWWKLTNIGSPTASQIVAFGGAVVLAVLYRGRRFWWAPSLTIVLGYFAEKFSQTILKLVVHRGHPPTTLGTWPSGGMGRLIDLYGLMIIFLVLRFAPRSPRIWALGGTALAVAASVQAYARLNNLEHWLTDVAGGAVYGLTLLAMMVLFFVALTWDGRETPTEDQVQGVHRRRNESIVG